MTGTHLWVRTITARAVVIGAAAGTIACGAGEPTGPVVHEHHVVERDAATSARIEIADETTPIDLEVHLGAGDTKLVLGRVNLQSLTIDLGAGDQTIDLRGTPARATA